MIHESMTRLLVVIAKRKIAFHCLLLCLVSLLAWGLVTRFWFFMGYESAWLMGVPHTLQGLFRSHAYIYYLNYLLFGWNPSGWYFVSILLHTGASLLSFFVLLSLTNIFSLSAAGSLFFVASITYHDVITWGSFNSYYALLMISVFASFLFYRQYLKKKKLFYFIFSLFFAFTAFYNRESGIMLVGVLFLYDVLFHWKIDRKYFTALFCRMGCFFLLVLLYLAIRNVLGDVVGDYADDSVQFRLKLQNDKQYTLLAFRTLLAFGRYYASLFLPYEALNYVREKIALGTVHADAVRFYFFTVVGFVNALVVLIITFLRRTSKYKSLYFFSSAWTFVWIFMISFAIPSTDTVLRQEYLWNTRRYEYYAFFGVCLFLATFLYELGGYIRARYKNSTLSRLTVPFIATLIVVLNILWLWKIEYGLLTTVHRRTNQFYQTFKKQFPTLPDDVVVYQFPHANGLNDLLGEWSVIRGQEYPNLKNRSFLTESQFARIIEKSTKGVISLPSTIFLDYSLEKGLVNHTLDALEIIRKVRETKISTDSVTALPEKTYPVEIPYVLDLTMSVSSDTVPDIKNAGQKILVADSELASKMAEYIVSSAVDVSATASQRSGEPFIFLDPKNLIDGNFGVRSGWMADSIPAVVTIDLKNTERIQGLFFSSEKGPRIPSSYVISYSLDGNTWIKTLERKNNTDTQRIDMFDAPISARFIRFTVDTTSTGAFLYLDEVGVIPATGSEVIKEYKNPKELASQVSVIPNARYAYAKIRWNTDREYAETPPQEFIVPVQADGDFHRYIFRVPEMEYFSRNGDFLKKYITNIAIDAVGPYNIKILSGSIKPAYEITNTR